MSDSGIQTLLELQQLGAVPTALCSPFHAYHPLVQPVSLTPSCPSPDSSMPFPRALSLSHRAELSAAPPLSASRLLSLSGLLFQCPVIPQWKEVLSHVQMEVPIFQFVPTASCSVAGNCQKRAWLHLLDTHPLHILINIGEIPSQSSLLQAEQPQVSQPFLVQDMPLIILVALHQTLPRRYLPFLN